MMIQDKMTRFYEVVDALGVKSMADVQTEIQTIYDMLEIPAALIKAKEREGDEAIDIPQIAFATGAFVSKLTNILDHEATCGRDTPDYVIKLNRALLNGEQAEYLDAICNLLDVCKVLVAANLRKYKDDSFKIKCIRITEKTWELKHGLDDIFDLDNKLKLGIEDAGKP
jgi:hypothetical protein